MPNLLEQVLLDPSLYASAFDGEHLIFRAMTRGTYEQSLFLDGRIIASEPTLMRAPIATLLAGSRTIEQPARPCFIFHVAHCGSTLLARALERGDQNLVLREPLALRQLGLAAAKAWPMLPPPEWQAVASLTHRLLAKRYTSDAPTVIKANVPVNFIAPWLLEQQPDTPAIFLYLPFDEYLLAVLRTEQHRSWISSVTDELSSVFTEIADLEDLIDPARMAAALWMVQMRIFADCLHRFPSTRSLDAGRFFMQPLQALEAAFKLYDMDVRQDDVARIVASPIFYHSAKEPSRPFSAADRDERRDDDTRRMGNEIRGARDWLQSKLDRTPLPNRLARPLFGDASALF